MQRIVPNSIRGRLFAISFLVVNLGTASAFGINIYLESIGVRQALANLAPGTVAAESAYFQLLGLLMTGYAHANEILKGLRVHGFLPEEGGALHVDILKLQHHGAEANIDEAFCRIVTADHYVFSGNGTHENPELAVINAVVSLRLENEETLTPFTLWFNSSEIDAGTELRSEHMGKVRERVEELVKGNEDLISFHFTDGEAGFEIDLD
jgi:hypothetical protein